MSLLEWVRVAEDAREQQDDERVATGLESLRMAVGELVPLDRVALIAVDSPERARNEIRAACRRLSTRDPWKALAPAVFRDLVEGLISTVFGLGPLEDLIADETVEQFLIWAVGSRRSIAVSGGTGSGKTTLLNALSCHISHEERVITIEDAAELKFDEHPHVVRLEARAPNAEGTGEVTIRELVVNALRMRPDRIIVGECRSDEAIDMLQAMKKGY